MTVEIIQMKKIARAQKENLVVTMDTGVLPTLGYVIMTMTAEIILMKRTAVRKVISISPLDFWYGPGNWHIHGVIFF